MTIYPTIKTGGGNIEMAVESALGTAGTYYDWRQVDNADPVFPTDTREVLAISSKGYRDPAKREPQISYEKYRENAITVATYATGSPIGAVDTDRPQFVRILESAGCTVVNGTATPVLLDGYTNVGAFSLTSDGTGIGEAGLLELESGVRWPTLTAAYSGSSTWNVTPSMEIPTLSAIGDDWTPMWTVTPPKGVAVSSARTLAFRVSSHYVTSTETGSCYIYRGCAAGDIKDVVFESGMPLKFESTLHVCDIAFDQSGIDLTSDAYADAIAIPVIDGDGSFAFGFADYTTAPITRATAGFRKATWKPGIQTIPVLESGSSTSLNGIGGYLGVYKGSTIELVMDVDKAWWTALESSGSQTPKYLELIQPSTATTKAALGLWIPNAYLKGKPSADLWGEKEMTVTFTLECASAPYSATSKTDQGSAPWYLGVSAIY